MAMTPTPSDYIAEDENIDDLIESATPQMLATQQKMQQRVDSKGVTYQWKDGINKLRLMPAKKGVGQAYFAARQHWVEWPGDDGKPRSKPFLCLAPTGQVCPLCELAASLSQDSSSAEAGKRMESRPTYIYNVLDMADPEGGAKVCFFSWEAHKSIAELWEAGEDPTSYTDGPIFSVKREKRGRVTYSTTPLSAKFPIPIPLLKTIHDLRKYAAIPSMDMLEHAVGVLTGVIPANVQYQAAMPSARPALGSRAAQAPSVPPPARRANIGSALKDE
jgi:hypothetical protein